MHIKNINRIKHIKQRHISLGTAIALVPLLSLALTAATHGLTFAFNAHTTNQRALEAEQSDWEKAIAKIAADRGSDSAADDCAKMERFFHTSHEAQARRMESQLLPKIDNQDVFDALFFRWLAGVSQDTQEELFKVDATIAGQLKDLYRVALANNSNLPAAQSFGDFLADPDQFFVNDTDRSTLAKTKINELDSATVGLNKLWTGRLSHLHPTPSGESISHVVFLNNEAENNDFQKVNFRDTANMTDVEFYGKCKVDQRNLPPNITSGLTD